MQVSVRRPLKIQGVFKTTVPFSRFNVICFAIVLVFDVAAFVFVVGKEGKGGSNWSVCILCPAGSATEW